jgi:WD40 repeat protein
MAVTAHFDGALRGWDFRQRGVAFEIKAHQRKSAFVSAIPGTNQVLSFGTEDRSLVVSDLYGRNVVLKGNHRGMVTREKVQLGIYSDVALIGGPTGEIYSYNLNTLKLKTTSKGAGSAVFCVTAKPSGGLVAFGDQTGLVRFRFG